MAIKWSKILGDNSTETLLKRLFPQVARWDDAALATYIPKGWSNVVTLSVGAPTSQRHERNQVAEIYKFGCLLFYRSSDQEHGPVWDDMPSSILSYHPGWLDIDKIYLNHIMHIEDHGWDAGVDILEAIGDVTPPWNYFSLNGEFLELDLDGEIKPFDPDRATDF